MAGLVLLEERLAVKIGEIERVVGFEEPGRGDEGFALFESQVSPVAEIRPYYLGCSVECVKKRTKGQYKSSSLEVLSRFFLSLSLGTRVSIFGRL